MNKKLESTAHHEAGHAIACILTNQRFKVVTINPDTDSLGHLKHEKSFISALKRNHNHKSFLNPADFNSFFKVDFIRISGLVSEKIYKGRFNHIGAGSDYQNWIDSTLLDLSCQLNSTYQRFLIQYVFDVLSSETAWSNIKAVASVLMQKRTLTYLETKQIIIEDNKARILNK